MLTLEDGSELRGERLIVAVGRRPRERGHRPGDGRRAPGPHGIPIDEHCRVTEGVWAAGDCTGVMLFTHLAKYQARVAMAEMRGRPVKADYRAIPRVDLHRPGGRRRRPDRGAGARAGPRHRRATVKLPETIARPYTYEQDPRGELSVLVDRRRRVLVGAWAVSPLASEWIHQAVLAIRAEVRVGGPTRHSRAIPLVLRGLPLGAAAARRLTRPPETAASLRSRMAGVASTPRRVALAVVLGLMLALAPAAMARAVAPPAAHTMHMTVTLRPRDPAALAAYAQAVSTPGSSAYLHYLTPAQFARRFGPTPAQIAAVRGALMARGLRPGATSAGGLSIPVSATAGQLEHAMPAALLQRALPGRRAAVAAIAKTSLGAAASPIVQSVLGLGAGAGPHPLLGARAAARGCGALSGSEPHVATGGPEPCSAAQTVASSDNAHTADQVASAYGFPGLYGAGDLGAGVTVAVYQLEPNSRLTSPPTSRATAPIPRSPTSRWTAAAAPVTERARPRSTSRTSSARPRPPTCSSTRAPTRTRALRDPGPMTPSRRSSTRTAPASSRSPGASASRRSAPVTPRPRTRCLNRPPSRARRSSPRRATAGPRTATPEAHCPTRDWPSTIPPASRS